MPEQLSTRVILATVLLSGLLSLNGAYALNSVVIPDRTVVAGAEGTTVPVFLTNDVAVRSFCLPLAIRGVSGSAFPTTLALGYRERLVSVLTDISLSNHYSDPGVVCYGDDPGGFANLLYNGSLPHPVTVDPWGVKFERARIFSPQLAAGTDSIGSLSLVCDIGTGIGVFEIDTTCIDPGCHILFTSSAGTAIRPSFQKATITVSSCDCPHQADLGPRSQEFDGRINLVDVVTLIDEIFFGGRAALTDPSCPRSRADFAPAGSCGDGVVDVLDLNYLIEYAFMGGGPICNPCLPE